MTGVKESKVERDISDLQRARGALLAAVTAVKSHEYTEYQQSLLRVADYLRRKVEHIHEQENQRASATAGGDRVRADSRGSRGSVRQLGLGHTERARVLEANGRPKEPAEKAE